MNGSLMKRLIFLSGLGLVKGGAASEAKIWRALRNNDKEISLDNKRPQINGSKECQNSNNISRIRRGTTTFHQTKRMQSTQLENTHNLRGKDRCVKLKQLNCINNDIQLTDNKGGRRKRKESHQQNQSKHQRLFQLC